MKQLYAVALEIRTPYGMKPELRYMHAKPNDYADERLFVEVTFLRSHSREIVSGAMRVIGVAPVIGYHVHDEHGEVLSA